MKKLFTLVLCLLALNSVFGQLSLGNYTYSSNTSGSLDPMVGATSLVGSGAIAAGYNDDNASGVNNIGFPFVFMGTAYTQFSANSNGQMQLGGTAVGSNVTPSAGLAIFGPMSGDNSAGVTGDADPMSYTVTGTAPNRIFVMQWRHFNVHYSFTNYGDNKMQVWLHENNGQIDFVYGSMYCNAANSYSIFLGSSNTATTAGYVTISSSTFTLAGSPVSNSFSVGSIPNLSSTTDGSRRVYSWTPPLFPTAETNLTFVPGLTTMQLNWTDSPNESLYYIQRSTDGVNYTTIATLNQNIVTYTATGLISSTLYYWKVIAANEVGSSALSGTKSTSDGTICGNLTVGVTGANYPTLTAAFADINTNGLACNTKLILNADYVSTGETFPLAPPAAAVIGSYTLTIYPSVTGLAITSANATGTINMNGCKNVVFDGRVGGTGSTNDLVIANTNLGTSYAIQFINDAISNTFKYCNIRSVNNSTSSGTIVFSTTTGANGNDNNTISNNNIYDGATTPYNAIYASGNNTTTATNNSGINISNNNIYNFFYAGGADNGIYVSSGNTDWTISGNSFYQTATRTYTASATHVGIYITNSSSGNNFSITGNYIGGGAASCGGTAWTFAGAYTNRFRGISISVGTTTASSVQGNTIANFSHTTNSSAVSAGGAWVGIYTSAGNINIGTVTGNTIGSGTGNGSLTLTLITNSGGLSSGIWLDGGTNLNVSNNTIGSVTIPTSTIGYGFMGIVSYTGTNVVINNNLIGSLTTANSININTGYTGTTAQIFRGIYVYASSTSTAITNNTIANINNNYLPATASTSNLAVGIYAPYGGINTITGNTIRDITTAANATGTTSSASVIGISFTASTAGATVSQNTIYGLSNTNSGANAINVTGIYYAGPTSGTNLISRNFIRSLNLSATIATAQLVGINFQSGLANIQNNMVRLGIDQSGNPVTNGIMITGINDVAATANTGIYYNSVYIGGNGVATLSGNTYAFQSTTTTATRLFKNNIFMNARSNGASTGKHMQ